MNKSEKGSAATADALPQTVSSRTMMEQLSQRMPHLPSPDLLTRYSGTTIEEDDGLDLLEVWLDRLQPPPTVALETARQQPETVRRFYWQLWQAGEKSVGRVLLLYAMAAKADPALANANQLQPIAEEVNQYRTAVQQRVRESAQRNITGEVVYLASLDVAEVLPNCVENHRVIGELYRNSDRMLPVAK